MFGSENVPITSNVPGKLTNGPRDGSAAMAAMRTRTSYASHADDDSPSSDEFTDLR